MSRARLAALAVGAVTALLVATIGVVSLVGGSGSPAGTARPPLAAGALATGTANAATAPAPSAAAAASTTSPQSQPTPLGGEAVLSARPKHVLAGYWQNFVNKATPLPLASVPRGYNLVDVAFAAAGAHHDGGVTFRLSPALAKAIGGYTLEQFTADVATLHQRGQRVLISVNDVGRSGAIDSPDAAANFAASVNALMKTYGFDGVDIDFEKGLNVGYTAQALRELTALRPGALITLAPQTADVESTSGAYFQLALSIRPILTVSFTQYYNSGAMLGCDGAERAQGSKEFMAALACTQLRGGLSPSQVGLGLPASASAARHGYVDPAVLDSALGCLATGSGCGGFAPPGRWPGIGGAMTWSINWDASNAYRFLRTVSPYLQSLP